MAPLCDLCVKSGMFNISTMAPAVRIDTEGKALHGAFSCQIHNRDYHYFFGYISKQTGSTEVPSFSVPCGKCVETRAMFISSATSPTDVTLRCIEGHEESASL